MCLTEGWLLSNCSYTAQKRHTASLMVSLANKEILKVSQQVESNRLRTRLCFWWWFHLVGFQVAPMLTEPGHSTAGCAHWSPLRSSEMQFTSEHYRCAAGEDREIVFSTFFCFFFPLNPPQKTLRCVCDTASKTKIKLLSQHKRKQVDTHS